MNNTIKALNTETTLIFSVLFVVDDVAKSLFDIGGKIWMLALYFTSNNKKALHTETLWYSGIMVVVQYIIYFQAKH